MKIKRYIVGAGINTRDYEQRIPALSRSWSRLSLYGFFRWIFCMAKNNIDFVRAKYGDSVKIGAGNVVDKEGF